MEKKIKMMGDFLRAIPKAELHSHLDGSMRTSTLIKLALDNKIDLPSYDPKALENILYKDKYENLKEVLFTFELFVNVLQTSAALEQVAYEMACDYLMDGVYYLEVRFAPQLHVGKGIDSIEKALIAVNQGLARAEKEFNGKPEVLAKEVPKFKYGIICCIMRTFETCSSSYYDIILKATHYAGEKAAHVHAATELSIAMCDMLKHNEIPIVALDLVGNEAGHPCGVFSEAFEIARKNLINVTIHAGEAEGPESIYDAVVKLHAQRLGHGFKLFHDELVTCENPKKFCENLANYIAKNRIGIEVCLTSNLQTNKAFHSIADHSFKKMLEHKISVCICCDNTSLSKTCSSKELELAYKAFNLSLEDMKSIVMNSFHQSFFCGKYAREA
eukprot:TRINITY_DN1151_c0_g1_i2.p2 TRINITY_DN1151_c0_g1~~TRINITY_DN1151_c0_g1_i2.p2  ORF type:complete len:387 (-),score=57.54 TRINITY_DN1151_c0_g1_i2:84-1244(-)